MKQPSEASLQRAAQAWCDPTTSHLEMDATLATMFARMLDEEKAKIAPNPGGFDKGFKIEHILISVTVRHKNNICQYDDSCAHILRSELSKYNGVDDVAVQVHYQHGKTEDHPNECQCGRCTSQNQHPG